MPDPKPKGFKRVNIVEDDDDEGSDGDEVRETYTNNDMPTTIPVTKVEDTGEKKPYATAPVDFELAQSLNPHERRRKAGLPPKEAPPVIEEISSKDNDENNWW